VGLICSEAGTCYSAEEFILNETTEYDQSKAALAPSGYGYFAAAWQTMKQDGDSYAIVARRFNVAGGEASDEVVVNETSTGAQCLPAITALESGGFAVVWRSDTQYFDKPTFYGRVMSGSLAPKGTEFHVSDLQAGETGQAVVLGMSGGGFVVLFPAKGLDGSVSGIASRAFDKEGAPLATEMTVNEFTSDEQEAPAAAILGSGGMVVAWQSRGQDGDGYGVYARLLDKDLTPLGGEFPLHEQTAGDQRAVAVAATLSGGFAVVWMTVSGVSGDIAGRFFDAAGMPAGPQFVVAKAGGAGLSDPSAAAREAGGLVAAWSEAASGSSAVKAVRIGDSGAPVGDVHDLPTDAFGKKQRPCLATLPGAGLVLTSWESLGQDGSYGGVYARAVEW
jgi:hypothetical protein